MGLNQSRQLGQQLKEACVKADHAGSTQVSGFLDDSFVRSAAAAIEDLNTNNDAFAKQVAAALKELKRNRTRCRGTRHRALRTTLRLNTQITLQYDIKQCLILWKYNISSFFEDGEGPLYDCQKATLGQLYKLLCHLEQKHVVDRVRRRISLAVLHSLLEKFERDRLHEEALNELASAVFQSGLAGNDMELVLDKLADWTKKGRRYNTLAESLGVSGSLALLPHEIGDTIWEHELPLKGKPHKETIQELQKWGICEEARKEWDIPVRQQDGSNTFYQTTVDEIVQEIFDLILRQSIWVGISTGPSQNPSQRTSQCLGAATNLVASTQQENRPDAYTSGTDSNQRAFFTTEVGVQGLMNPDTQARLSTIAVTSSSEMTRSRRLEQSLQSPASRLPSLQHLIHTNSTTRLGDDHPDGYDGLHTTTDGAIGASIGGVRHQSFSEHNPASFSPSNPVHGAHGSQTTCGFESRQETQWMAGFRRPLQPNADYDLTEVTCYGSAVSDIESATYEPLSHSQINYNLTNVTPYGSSQQTNLDESCPQPNINYSLTEVTPFGFFQ
ncbi:MAG: hypothetical protein Q9209_007160 [Squamulea sp. 1 TL-2023]